MASQPEVSEISSTIERLIRNRSVSFFVPFVLGLSNNLQRQELDQPPQQQQQQQELEQEQQDQSMNRVILINPFTQGMVVVEGAETLDSLLRQLGNHGADKEGQPPASKSAIEALPRVEISEEDGGSRGECSICLEEFCVGGFAKEMPCKHRFHGDCIDRWLGIHRTCPICRHEMPSDKEESESKRRVSQREIWVSFSFNGSNNGTSRAGGEAEEESNRSGSTEVADHDSNAAESQS